MLSNAPSVERLLEALRRLPGVGKRSAQRIAMHVLTVPEGEARDLSEAILEARHHIRMCSTCRNLSETDPCGICSDETRDRTILCVVERPAGAEAIERAGSYRGVYHVLHGVISPLDGIGPQELFIERLIERVKQSGIKEVIVATNATVEGEGTAQYLWRQLSPLGVLVTRIAHGVPMGGGVEFADDLTLARALQGRTTIA